MAECCPPAAPFTIWRSPRLPSLLLNDGQGSSKSVGVHMAHAAHRLAPSRIDMRNAGQSGLNIQGLVAGGSGPPVARQVRE